jgi:23S rRNA (cytosine1962-C5)-methyltransferase
MEMIPVYLKKREEKRLRNGHPWLFSNEVDVRKSPLKSFTPGQPVQVRTHGEEVIGCGYINPNSLICVRLLSRDPNTVIDQELLRRRLRQSISLREELFDAPFYRMVYGEGDALPGLVIDRYGDVLVAQIGTAGMDQLTSLVIDTLREELSPKGILLRNDGASRELEGLERFVDTAYGHVPETLELPEHGARFQVSPATGQKTGWYYDHRSNRARTLPFAKGRTVLDLFSYVGAWGVQMAVAGATEVTCVDSAESAIAAVNINAELSGVADRVRTVKGDVMNIVKELRREGQQYDVVVVDPPAFVPRRKDQTAGTEAYRRLNGVAMQLVREGGLLVSASCSYHFSREKHLETLARVARGNRQHAQILFEGGQGPDHPSHPALPESVYLSTFFTRVTEP